MKKFYIFLCLAIAALTQLQAQAPQGFNYQATVRNTAGDLLVSTNVYFKFNVIQDSQPADPIFTETHEILTDDLGQVNLIIGQGTANTGVFSELDWSLGSYYLGIELSINGDNNYVPMGTTQLLSVPYALYAEGYDYILNLSALKHVRSEKDPFTLMRLIEVNILNTIETVQIAKAQGAKKYFCVSTDKAANPVNMMGASKRIMEMFLMRESETMPISMARFANACKNTENPTTPLILKPHTNLSCFFLFSMYV